MLYLNLNFLHLIKDMNGQIKNGESNCDNKAL